jgi:hypothetical protein
MSAHNNTHLRWSFLTNICSLNNKQQSQTNHQDKLPRRMDLTTFLKPTLHSSLLQFQISINHLATTLEVNKEAISLARSPEHLSQF